MKVHHLLYFLLAVFLFSANIGYSQNKVPANPHPIEYKQPDGSIVTITLKGDEHLHWAITSDGFTVIISDKGCYEYAKLGKNNELICSGVQAHNPGERTRKEKRAIKKIPKGLQYNATQIEGSKPKPKY